MFISLGTPLAILTAYTSTQITTHIWFKNELLSGETKYETIFVNYISVTDAVTVPSVAVAGAVAVASAILLMLIIVGIVFMFVIIVGPHRKPGNQYTMKTDSDIHIG